VSSGLGDDDGGSKHLWNVGKLLPDYTAQQPRRQPSSYSPPWEFKNPTTFFRTIVLKYPTKCLRATRISQWHGHLLNVPWVTPRSDNTLARWQTDYCVRTYSTHVLPSLWQRLLWLSCRKTSDNYGCGRMVTIIGYARLTRLIYGSKEGGRIFYWKEYVQPSSNVTCNICWAYITYSRFHKVVIVKYHML
jgi:hypothetical protein